MARPVARGDGVAEAVGVVEPVEAAAAAGPLLPAELERVRRVVGGDLAVPATRDDAMYCLAAVLVRHGAAVHGGFVRDSLVLGEPASDLDARVPAGFDWDAVKAEAARVGLQLQLQSPAIPGEGLVEWACLPWGFA